MFCSKCGAERKPAGYCESCGAGPINENASGTALVKNKGTRAFLVSAAAILLVAGTVALSFYLGSQNGTSSDVAASTGDVQTTETSEPEAVPDEPAYDGPVLELTKRQIKYGFEPIPSTDLMTANSAAFRYADDTDLEYWGCVSGDTCGLVYVTALASCQIIEIAYTEFNGSKEWLRTISGPTVDESGLMEPGYGAPIEIPIKKSGSTYSIDDSACVS
jgi:hypothetical protein